VNFSRHAYGTGNTIVNYTKMGCRPHNLMAADGCFMGDAMVNKTEVVSRAKVVKQGADDCKLRCAGCALMTTSGCKCTAHTFDDPLLSSC
jgi:hypothetical protein